MRRRRAPLPLLSALAGLLVCAACGTGSAAMRHDRDVDVPMRDGVILRAHVMRPDSAARVPTLVYRTPYGAADAIEDYTTFAAAVDRGYAVVVQDVRGRYRSDGRFRPYQDDGRDGYDTIEWAAAQPWSDGTVGTFGLSYPGAVQWLAAMEAPPHLKAMVPAMTFSSPRSFFYTAGTWDLSWLPWILINIAPDERARRDLPGPRTAAEAQQQWEADGTRWLHEVPLAGVADLRDVAPYYDDWLKHPPEDSYWNFAELRGRYRRTDVAVLNLSGWYDDSYGPEGAITNFTGLVAARGRPDRTALLIGPWVHGVHATGQSRAGEREFGLAAAIDYDAVVLDWMDRHVRSLPGGALSPVRYFVMGANVWRSAASWPPPAERKSYVLTPGLPHGRGGLLIPAPQDSAGTSPGWSQFVSDPDSPVRNPYDSAGAHDYRALDQRADVVSFESAELTEDTEVTGPIAAELYVSCDCRDTDLWVRLLDVARDGTALNLMSPGLDVVRASYRESEKGRQLLSPGEIYLLKLENLVTSHVFKAGHRIRLQVSASFFPNFSRNLHSGELETTSDRRQKATIRIHHDPAHQSRLTLPIVRLPDTMTHEDTHE